MSKPKAGNPRGRFRSRHIPAKPVGMAGLERLFALWGPPKVPVCANGAIAHVPPPKKLP